MYSQCNKQHQALQSYKDSECMCVYQLSCTQGIIYIVEKSQIMLLLSTTVAINIATKKVASILVKAPCEYFTGRGT